MPRKTLSFFALLVLFAVTLTAVPSQQDQPWAPSPHVAPTDPLPPEEARKKFQLPPGFEMQLVAAEPDVMNPLNIAFDARGRLWVTTSSEYPYAAQDKKTKDTVKILEDFGPDGKAGKVTTFGEDLNIPIGVLPLGDGSRAIVFSIPDLWLLEDTDGDGQADKKSVLLAEYGQRDTHGLTGEFQLGFDGWVYACHGFSNTSTVKGSDGSAITMQSGNVYRFRPDGSHVQYFTHGQVNPFGLAFDPLGNLFSADCHTRPIYQLLEGAYYPSFGKPHDGIGFGPEMMEHNHGSTAIAGVTYYAADHFPEGFRGNVFIGNVVTNRINRDTLERHGSTYRAIAQPDFVATDDRWFRPVDIKLGPDGALYVADFYNRIIGHYEVPLDHPGRDRTHGRIWRIVYKGEGGTPLGGLADRTKATVEQLVADLASPNLTVRLTATDLLAKRGGREVIGPVLRRVQARDATEWERAHGLWVLHRSGADVSALLADAARTGSPLIRVHAMRILADKERLEDAEREVAVGRLKDDDAFVQRAAAQALGKHPDPRNIQPLLELWYSVPADDTHLLHVARMAVRDQLRPGQTWGELQALRLGSRGIRSIAEVSLSLPTPQAAAFLLDHIGQLTGNRGRLLEYARHISRYGGEGSEAQLVAFASGEFAKDLRMQADVARAVQQGVQERGGKLHASVAEWSAKVCTELLGSADPGQVAVGIDLAADLRLASAQERLCAVVAAETVAADQRGKAAAALTKIDPAKHLDLLGRILKDGAQPLPVREQVSAALAAANLPPAREALVQTLAVAPAQLQAHIARDLAASQQGADQLLDAVAGGKGSARLLQDAEVERRLRGANPPQLNERLARLTQGLPPANEQLLAVLEQRRAGFLAARASADAGLKVFEKTCAACHQVNNKGGKIAPQLDGVGIRGPARLLEDVLDPNRNVDQEFRSTVLTLKNGQVVSGLLLRQEGQVLVLADKEGKETRVEAADVEERIVSPVSPMPANFAEGMPEQDLYDLLAYLLRQRPAEAGQPTESPRP